jgi:hypothetical protein
VILEDCGGTVEGLTDILAGQVGQTGGDFFGAHPVSDHGDDGGDGDMQPANAGLPVHLVGVDGDRSKRMVSSSATEATAVTGGQPRPNVGPNRPVPQCPSGSPRVAAVKHGDRPEQPGRSSLRRGWTGSDGRGRPHNPSVVGSIPTGPTRKAQVKSPVVWRSRQLGNLDQR